MTTRPCLWPGCTKVVRARFWGCRPHWYALPESIRSRIWSAYRPGQEAGGPISDDYLAAIREAERWIRRFEASRPGRPAERDRSLLPGLDFS